VVCGGVDHCTCTDDAERSESCGEIRDATQSVIAATDRLRHVVVSHLFLLFG
jgi:hypothetical protein